MHQPYLNVCQWKTPSNHCYQCFPYLSSPKNCFCSCSFPQYWLVVASTAFLHLRGSVPFPNSRQSCPDTSHSPFLLHPLLFRLQNILSSDLKEFKITHLSCLLFSPADKQTILFVPSVLQPALVSMLFCSISLKQAALLWCDVVPTGRTEAEESCTAAEAMHPGRFAASKVHPYKGAGENWGQHFCSSSSSTCVLCGSQSPYSKEHKLLLPIPPPGQPFCSQPDKRSQETLLR